MRLCAENLERLDPRVKRPTYDRGRVSVGIVHFGVGGFHRAHQAMYLDRLMNQGLAFDWGICGVGVMPADQAMHEALVSQDCFFTLMVRRGLDEVNVRVIGSIVDYLYAPHDPGRVLDVMTKASTRIVSLTITEGGYNLNQVTGEFEAANLAVQADLVPGAEPGTMFGFVVEALRRRRAMGVAPFTVVSCDNLQGNGRAARASIVAFAALSDPDLAEWIGREVPFPNSMVDRITPTTAPKDISDLRDRFGLEDRWPVVCEPFTQWVLEDQFVNERPPLEHAGVQLTWDVEPYELMKLRLLNASHQAMAYSGYLSGYTYAHEVATDPVFVEFLRGYMDLEARPTLGDVPGIDLDDYVATLIERFADPAVRDTLARLCAFSSDRIPKWVVPVIRANLATGGEITRAVAIVASWARYAEGVDEKGRSIDMQDVMRDELMARAQQQYDHPLAFVRSKRLFGHLADNSEFARCYERCLKAFHAGGAHRTLADLNKALRGRTRVRQRQG